MVKTAEKAWYNDGGSRSEVYCGNRRHVVKYYTIGEMADVVVLSMMEIPDMVCK